MVRKFLFVLTLLLLFGSLAYAAPLQVSVADYTVTAPGVLDVSIVLSNTGDQTQGEEVGTFGITLVIEPPSGAPANGVIFGDSTTGARGDAVDSGDAPLDFTRNSDTQMKVNTGFGVNSPFSDGVLFTLQILANDPGYYGLTFTEYEFGVATMPWITPPVDSLDGSITVNAVPIPGAVWLLGSGLVGLIGLKRRNRS